MKIPALLVLVWALTAGAAPDSKKSDWRIDLLTEEGIEAEQNHDGGFQSSGGVDGGVLAKGVRGALIFFGVVHEIGTS